MTWISRTPLSPMAAAILAIPAITTKISVLSIISIGLVDGNYRNPRALAGDDEHGDEVHYHGRGQGGAIESLRRSSRYSAYLLRIRLRRAPGTSRTLLGMRARIISHLTDENDSNGQNPHTGVVYQPVI